MKDKENQALLPTNDFIFKRIFGKEGNERITKRLLSSIIEDEIDEISLNEETILEKDLMNDKMGILDIKAKLVNGTIIDLEMQIANKKDIEKRLLYYWSKIYSTNIKSGEKYKELKRVIVIMFANFELTNFKNIKKYHTEWKIREKDYGNCILTNDFEVDIIEIPKLKKYSTNIENTQNKELQTWIQFLTNPNEMEAKTMEEIEEVKMAKEELDKIRQNKREERLAELRQKYIMDQNAIEEYGYDRGKEEGIKENRLEIAKKMLEQNATIEFVVTCTGLTKEQVEKLREKVK